LRWADPPSRDYYQNVEMIHNFISISELEQVTRPNPLTLMMIMINIQ